MALLAIRSSLAGDAGVTAALETKVQNVLHSLRTTSPCAEPVSVLENLAVTLRKLADAKREGRCNLYASQLARLRKQSLDWIGLSPDR